MTNFRSLILLYLSLIGIYLEKFGAVLPIKKGKLVNSKMHYRTKEESGSDSVIVHNPPLLFNLNTDPSEKYNIAEKHPDIISELKEILKQHQSTIVPVENQLEK